MNGFFQILEKYRNGQNLRRLEATLPISPKASISGRNLIGLIITILVGLSVSSCATVEQGERVAGSDVTTNSLINGEWRIWSSVFSQVPESGYPIKFHSDGSVETANLPTVKEWDITTTGEVLLLSKRRIMLYQLSYKPSEKGWVSSRRTGYSEVVLHLYPLEVAKTKPWDRDELTQNSNRTGDPSGNRRVNAL
jgi:hypothetical protein